MQSIGIRQLRERGGELESMASQGETVLLTKNGKPLFISIPFDNIVVEEGTRRALALRFFELEVLSRGAAAKAADMSLNEFLQLASKAGIAVMDHDDGELEQELKTLG